MNDASIPPSNVALIGKALHHESAHLHVAGEATYIDDIVEPRGTLHAALGRSTKPHARIVALDLDAVRAAPGVIAVLTAAGIPGVNDCGPVLHDDPILADGLVQYVGQPIFAVAATSVKAARRPQNGRVARKKPSGRPRTHATSVAVTATFKVRSTTPPTAASPPSRRAKARCSPSPRKSTPARS